MRSTYLYLCLSALLFIPAGLGLAQQNDLYREARKDLDAGRFNVAADKFGRSAAQGGKEADAALYWKAYAQKKGGKPGESLATLKQLAAAHPKSDWLDDARALEIEIRENAGQSPDLTEEGDEETKLYALNSLIGADPKRAVPLLLKFLAGPHSLHLKQQALFVLSQSNSADARKTLVEIARGNRYPELQKKAIESLGIGGDEEDISVLAEIYGGSGTPLKLAVLDAYMIANERGRILTVARSEKEPAARRKALELLGPIGARQELRQLYRDTSVAAVDRMLILNGLAISGDVEALSSIARDEKEPGPLRRKAIEGLGISRSAQSAAALKSLYSGSTDAGVRQAALEGLFIQNNAKALIELYRNEKDTRLRREIIQRLSHMSSPEADEFLLKIFGD